MFRFGVVVMMLLFIVIMMMMVHVLRLLHCCCNIVILRELQILKARSNHQNPITEISVANSLVVLNLLFMVHRDSS